MEIIECVHFEDMTTGENHTEVGVCRKCGRTVIYDRVNPKAQPLITKLGRKDGKIVVPTAGFNTQLSGKDLADLRVANMGPASSKHPMATKAQAPNIPPRPGEDDPEARLLWYHDHKKEMIRDLLAMEYEAFLKKWGVSRQTVSHLKSDKYYEKLAKKAPPAPSAEPKAAKAGEPSRADKPKGEKLPQLPEWSDEWTPEIKLAWLDIYGRLIK